MQRARDLEQTPSLVDTDVADQIGHHEAAVSGLTAANRAEAGGSQRTGRGTSPQVEQRGAAEHGRIIEADGDGVMAAEEERGVVARITMPRRGIGGRRLTEGKTRELDERELDRDKAAARATQNGIGQATESIDVRGESVGVRRTEVLKLEVALQEGTNDAVFSCGTRIDGERHTRTAVYQIAEAIALAAVTVPERSIVDTAVERGVDAHITTQLEAGVGARNIEKTGTIQGADPHVLDRFGLDGKISCLCPAHGDKTRR